MQKLTEIASQFVLEGQIESVKPLGEGFINDTFLVRTYSDAPDYILQRKNKAVFPDVPGMMENIAKVTAHIRRRVEAEGGNPLREVLTVVPSKNGALYFVDEEGEYWAVSLFIADTIAYDRADTPLLLSREVKA